MSDNIIWKEEDIETYVNSCKTWLEQEKLDPIVPNIRRFFKETYDSIPDIPYILQVIVKVRELLNNN